MIYLTYFIHIIFGGYHVFLLKSFWNIHVIMLVLKEIIVNTINDDFSLSQVFVSSHSLVMRCWWLVHRPVIKWCIGYWITHLHLSFVLQKVIVDAINNDFSLTEVFISSHTPIMWSRWLIGRPIVEWWVYHWVTQLKEYIFRGYISLMVPWCITH